MAGVCLIRLEGVRPKPLPPLLGIASANAAHRIAVEWNDGPTVRQGVFIPRRDTDSALNRIAGGRIFPGVHHPATFQCAESSSRFKVELRSLDGAVFVRVATRLAGDWPRGSIFNSLQEASDFFQAGSCGWSPARREGCFEGLELRTPDWHVEPLIVERIESSFFQHPGVFPPGSVEFDCALSMRGIAQEWRALPPWNFARKAA
jgi:hypothetical protein